MSEEGMLERQPEPLNSWVDERKHYRDALEYIASMLRRRETTRDSALCQVAAHALRTWDDDVPVPDAKTDPLVPGRRYEFDDGVQVPFVATFESVEENVWLDPPSDWAPVTVWRFADRVSYATLWPMLVHEVLT